MGGAFYGFIKTTIYESSTPGTWYVNGFNKDFYYFSESDLFSSGIGYIQNVIDWVDANDISDVYEALDERISIVNDLPSEPATITDYNKGKSFYVINDGIYPSTVKGHQLYHADYKLVTAPATIKYDYWTSGEYYEYMFESDKTIEVGDTVYLVSSYDDKTQLSRDVIVEVDGDYLAPSSMIDNSDGYIAKGNSPYESSAIGEAYMLDWVPMYDLSGKQDKIVYEKMDLPNAYRLYENPAIIEQTGHTIIGVNVNYGTPIDLYAIIIGGNHLRFTTKLPINTSNVFYEYDDAGYYAENTDYVDANGNYHYLPNGWSSYSRRSADDTTTDSLYIYEDIDGNDVEKISDLSIDSYNITEYYSESPYIVNDRTSELFGKTVILTSKSETGTWYEWARDNNKVYTKTNTVAVGTDCWFIGFNQNKTGLLIKDTLVEGSDPHVNLYLCPSTTYGHGNTWEFDTTQTPTEKSDYTVTYAVWEDVNAGSSGGGTLTADITFNVKVGGWDVGDVAHAGMTQQAFNERIAHEYKEPGFTFTTTSATLVQKGTSLAAPTVTATSTKIDLDISKTAIVYGGSEVETSTVASGATLSYTFSANLTTDTTINATVTDARKTITKTIKFEFIDPFYYGNSDTSTLTQQAVEALTVDVSKKGNKTKAYTANNKYLVFAYPTSYGNLTQINDQNGYPNINSWTKNVVIFNEGLANEVSYNVYVSNNTITTSNFKYTFVF